MIITPICDAVPPRPLHTASTHRHPDHQDARHAIMHQASRPSFRPAISKFRGPPPFPSPPPSFSHPARRHQEPPVHRRETPSPRVRRPLGTTPPHRARVSSGAPGVGTHPAQRPRRGCDGARTSVAAELSSTNPAARVWAARERAVTAVLSWVAGGRARARALGVSVSADVGGLVPRRVRGLRVDVWTCGAVRRGRDVGCGMWDVGRWRGLCWVHAGWRWCVPVDFDCLCIAIRRPSRPGVCRECAQWGQC
ncbi:hypothetical protein BD413DRAFT_1466 [Trametes elegans]|nr:hypothetical protein BD413DRAFT_1466 [Trametes elegans]